MFGQNFPQSGLVMNVILWEVNNVSHLPSFWFVLGIQSNCIRMTTYAIHKYTNRPERFLSSYMFPSASYI